MISDDDLLLDSEHEEDITFEKQSIWSQESAGAVAKALGDCIDEQELAGTRVANEHDERIWSDLDLAFSDEDAREPAAVAPTARRSLLYGDDQGLWELSDDDQGPELASSYVTPKKRQLSVEEDATQFAKSHRVPSRSKSRSSNTSPVLARKFSNHSQRTAISRRVNNSTQRRQASTSHAGSPLLDRTNSFPTRRDDLFDLDALESTRSVRRVVEAELGVVGSAEDIEQSSWLEDELAQDGAAASHDVFESPSGDELFDHERASAEQEVAASAPESSTELPPLPTIGDHFPSRLAILTALSFASHARGYRCRILQSPIGQSQRSVIGCSRRVGNIACPSRLHIRLVNKKEPEGEWEVYRAKTEHTHPPRKQGAWKAPVQPSRKRKKVAGQSEVVEGQGSSIATSQVELVAVTFEPDVAPIKPQVNVYNSSPSGVVDMDVSRSRVASPARPPKTIAAALSRKVLETLPANSQTNKIHSFIDPALLDDSLDLSPTRQYAKVPSEPTQAEMDAFFGYVPPAASTSSQHEPMFAPMDDDGEPLSRLASSQKGKGRAVEELKDDGSDAKKDQEPSTGQEGSQARTEAAQKDEEAKGVYQLSPLPTVSPTTGAPLTSDEKRLAIIDSLERVARSVLSQLADAVVPPAACPIVVPSEPSDGTPSVTSAESQSQSQSTSRPARWKPRRIEVVLRKRGDATKESADDGPSTRTISFPHRVGKPARLGGRELAAFLKVVEIVLDGLKRGVVATKRDIFYRNVALFVKQQVVDSLVEDIAATLQVRRGDLNVVAASKGLFAGALEVFAKDGSVIEGGPKGALIPPEQLVDRVEYDKVRWVLVIEKEAVFQTLCSSSFLKTLSTSLGNGIILTGKGYPDVSTRELVHRLARDLPHSPILALVDSDPHGLDILSTYRFGSSAMSFDRENLVVDRIEWMGVKGTEWDTMGVDRDELLLLSMQDRRKALSMLKREGLPEEWRYELEYMLHLGRKAEIQILSSVAAGAENHSQASTQGNTDSVLFNYIKGKLSESIKAHRAVGDAGAPPSQ